MFRNTERSLRVDNKKLQERLDAMEERLVKLESCINTGGGYNEECAQLQNEQEKLRIKLWHMGYEYDKLLSAIELEKAENIMPGNKKILEGLKDKYKGQQCFIIGNGPSLSVEDLDRIKGKMSFACNKIGEIYQKTAWRPDFYFCTDEMAYASRVLEFAKNQQWIFMSTDFLPYISELKNNMIFFPLFSRYCITPEFSLNPLRGIYAADTVLYIAAQFAIYMGFQELVLLGVDSDFKMTYTEDGRKVLKLWNAHFYKDDEKDFEAWESLNAWMDFNDTLHSGIYNIQDGWKMLQYQSEKLGFSVINATRGGALEVFPRRDLENIIK